MYNLQCQVLFDGEQDQNLLRLAIRLMMFCAHFLPSAYLSAEITDYSTDRFLMARRRKLPNDMSTPFLKNTEVPSHTLIFLVVIAAAGKISPYFFA